MCLEDQPPPFLWGCVLSSERPGSRVFWKAGTEWSGEKLAVVFKQQNLLLSHPSPSARLESQIYGC